MIKTGRKVCRGKYWLQDQARNWEVCPLPFPVVTIGKRRHSFQSYPTFFFNKNKIWSGQGNQFPSDQYRNYFCCLSLKSGEPFPTYLLPLTLPLPLKLWSSCSVGVNEHRCFWHNAAMPAYVSWWSGPYVLAWLGLFVVVVVCFIKEKCDCSSSAVFPGAEIVLNYILILFTISCPDWSSGNLTGVWESQKWW